MSFNNPFTTLSLGGLMGASPYSNVSIFTASPLEQQRHSLLQNLQRKNTNQRNNHPPHALTMTSGQYYNTLRSQQVLSQALGLGIPSPILGPSVPQQPMIKFSLPDYIIQELLCRFIMNVPEEEKFDPVRALFQVELAHWFYLDNYCNDEGDPGAPKSIPFNQFAYIMFKEAPHLRQYFHNVDKYLADFRNYRSRVPTFGAILMNRELTKLVMVQGFRNSWGFPKGKVNENEDPVECAIREVYEETGYDIRSLLNPRHYIESKAQDRNDRLYLIRGVDSNFPFFPKTQYEIKQIAWFNIDEIPEHKKDPNPKILIHGQPVATFFTAYPYMKRLKLWVTDKLEGHNKIQCFRSKYLPNLDEEELTESYSSVFQPTAANVSVINHPNKKTEVLSLGGQERNVIGEVGKTKDRKGTKSQRRLFSESDREDKKTAQDVATFLSKTMGIPTTCAKPLQLTTTTTKTTPSNAPSTIPKWSPPKPLKVTKMSDLFDAVPIPSCWENFAFNSEKMLKEMQPSVPRYLPKV